MTLGVGQPDSDEWAAYRATHDRGLASALSGTIHSSDALSITRGEDVLTEIHNTNDYLQQQYGVPWPTPEPPYRLERTVASAQGNINKGWNAAAQPGEAPGMNVPMQQVRDVRMGGISYAEALNYNPAPLTDNLGSLRGPYQEPQQETRPGFGRVDAVDVLAAAFIALGAYGGYKLAEDKNAPTKVAATAGGAIAAWVVAAVVSLGSM